MTELQRLQNTTLENEFFKILHLMLGNDIDYTISDNESLTMYERVTVDNKPPLEQMQTEFTVWQFRAIEREESRIAEIIRKKELKDRFINLKNGSMAFNELYPNVPNKKLFLKEMLEKDSLEAEQSMQDLEEKDNELELKRLSEDAKEDERITEIAQIKQAIGLIQESDKPGWEKKLLIRLVKELKE